MELNLRYNRHFYSSALLNPLDAPMQRTWERAKLATTLDHVGKSSIYLIDHSFSISISERYEDTD